MNNSVVRVKKIMVLRFSKLSYKVPSAYMLSTSSDICLQNVYTYAKQKHLERKKCKANRKQHCKQKLKYIQ